MMTVRSKLKRSRIHGIGVFAVERIRKGAVVWRLDERFCVMIPEADLPSIHPTMRKHIDTYGYPHMTRPGVICCDADNGRFMNHSNSANTVFTEPSVARAARDIAAGEEITCNYAEFIANFEGYPDTAVKQREFVDAAE